MNICRACGVSKTLCGHPDWGWLGGPLRAAALRFVLGFLFGQVEGLLPLFQQVPSTSLVPKLGSELMDVTPEVDWVKVRKVVAFILLVLLL